MVDSLRCIPDIKETLHFPQQSAQNFVARYVAWLRGYVAEPVGVGRLWPSGVYPEDASTSERYCIRLTNQVQELNWAWYRKFSPERSEVTLIKIEVTQGAHLTAVFTCYPSTLSYMNDHHMVAYFDLLIERTLAEFGGEKGSPVEGQGMEEEAVTGRRRTPRKETRRKAEIFRTIKTEHPEWSYAQVAREAERAASVRAGQGETAPKYNEDDVRNVYRAMGWEWEKANVIRAE
jgi:hypothetical protein